MFYTYVCTCTYEVLLLHYTKSILYTTYVYWWMHIRPLGYTYVHTYVCTYVYVLYTVRTVCVYVRTYVLYILVEIVCFICTYVHTYM